MQIVNYEQLVNAAIDGNESAFRKLYEISSGKAYYAALCVTKNEKDAVNIMQSSYSTMRERLPRLKYPQMFENWFYRIVCKCIYERISTVSTTLFDSFNVLEVSRFDDELDGVFVNDRNPEKAQSDKATVTRILDRLPLDRKLCFLMYYYFKMNIAEISKITCTDEMVIAHFLDESKKIVKANIKDVFMSQNRTMSCPPIVFYTHVLQSCSSHVPFKATDMILGNIFNTRSRADEPIRQNRPVRTDVTVSESESTQMYSSEEMERLLEGNEHTVRAGAYGKESSKGGDDDIPAAESAAKAVKIVLAVLVAIIFIVAVIALLKNIISDNNNSNTETTEQTTIYENEVTSVYETVATTVETTQETTTQAPTTTEAYTEPPTSESVEQQTDAEENTESSLVEEYISKIEQKLEENLKNYGQ